MNKNPVYNNNKAIFMDKNRVIKIPVHSKIKIFVFFIILLISSSALAADLIKVILNNFDIPDFVFYLIFIAMIGLGLFVAIPKIFDKKGYLLTIKIAANDITLIYRANGKISNIITIPTEDIKSFFVKLEITENHISTPIVNWIRLDYEMKIFIKTTCAPIPITINNYFFNAKSLMLNLTKYSYYIPKFSYKVEGYYPDEEDKTHIIDAIKKEFDYCARYGKKMPLYRNLFNFWSKLTLFDKILTIIVIFYILFLVLMGLFPDTFYPIYLKIKMITGKF